MDANSKREIILENYQNPYHKELIDNKNLIKINTRNQSCIDNLDFQINLEENKIKEIYFTGEACAISTATSSIMIKLLENKSIEKSKIIINNYINMINELPYDEKILNEAIVFDEIYKQQNRKHCALLPWEGLAKLLDDLNQNN